MNNRIKYLFNKAIFSCFCLFAFANSLFSQNSLPNPDSLSDEVFTQYVYQLRDRALDLENKLIQNAQRLVYSRQIREQQLSEIIEENIESAEEIEVMKQDLAALKKEEKIAVKKRKRATTITENVVKSTKKDLVLMRKSFPKIRTQVKELCQLADENSAVLVPMEGLPSQLPAKTLLGKPTVSQAENDKTDTESTEKPKKAKKEKKKKAESESEIATAEQVPETETPEKKEKKPRKKAKKVEETAKIEMPESEHYPLAEEPTTKTEKAESEKTEDENADKTAEKEEKKRKKAAKKEDEAIANYKEEEDVMLNPPLPTCEFVVDGKDEFSGEIRRELKKEELFRHTNDLLKTALGSEPHIRCEANLGVSGSITYLYLSIAIRDQSAKRSFGGLSRGSAAIIKLINGTSINLIDSRSDEGTPDETGDVFTFKAQYPLDKSSLKKLKDHELDKIRIAWNRGYEDYELFNIDIIKRQLNCLEN